MVRSVSILASVGLLALSCGPTEVPATMGFAIRVPQITLDRLDDQVHLRVVPKANLTCNTTTGQVMLNGVRAVDAIPGKLVNPVLRCDATMWTTQRAMYTVRGSAEAAPVDLCFSRATSSRVDVPAGTYIVLVEASGISVGAGGVMRHILLGSGCAEVTARSGQTQSTPITMVEQAEVGVCGDLVVAPNESCDEGMATDACDATCQFPERAANLASTLAPANPSIGWASGQRMIVGFDATDDPYAHMFDPSGAPITSPAALANDNVLSGVLRFEQHFVRFAASTAGYAAVWQSSARNLDFDVKLGLSTYDAPPPALAEVMANPTSMTPGTMGTGRNCTHPVVATSATRTVVVFEDAMPGTLRVASTGVAMPAVAPTADAPLVTAGMGMANASSPQIAATASGFVVAWSAGTVGSRDVFAIRLDAMGTPTGMPITVNTQLGNDQDQPTIAAAGNDVVIAWRDDSRADAADNLGTTVRWRHFDAALTADGADRIAPSTVAGDQLSPAIALAPNGVILIAWEDAPTGAIRGRLLRAAGGGQVVNRVAGNDGDFEVDALAAEPSHGTGPRHTPAAAYGGTGLFAVVWADQALMQIRMRTLRAD